MTQLYTRNGEPPAPLPKEAMDAEGFLRTSFHDDPEMIAALGFVVAPCPYKISQLQGKEQLRIDGDFDTVEQMVLGANDISLYNYWTSASHWERDNPKLLMMATALGKNEADIDNFFTLAYEIR